MGEDVVDLAGDASPTVMSQDRRGQILDAVTGVLAPGGRFTAELARRFDRLERSRTVWANLPPAFVHRAVRRP
ncbi:hypothetical protein ABZ608_27415 [Streptomyces sp. NPDC013172]|uniref:hypothetical protein n=1 Tax=Streptomyces sp. NPDC013172 TaxID=3155009 RepID=UPI0033D71BE3